MLPWEDDDVKGKTINILERLTYIVLVSTADKSPDFYRTFVLGILSCT